MSLKLWTQNISWFVSDDNKQDTLVSWTNIKTINSNSILWVWDIVIEWWGWDTVNIEILTANKTLVEWDDVIQILDLDWVDRTLFLPASPTAWTRFTIKNNVTNIYEIGTLTIETSTSVYIDKLMANAVKSYIWDWATWETLDWVWWWEKYWVSGSVSLWQWADWSYDWVAVWLGTIWTMNWVALWNGSQWNDFWVWIWYWSYWYNNGIAIWWGSKWYNSWIAIWYNTESSLNLNSYSWAIGWKFKNTKDYNIAFSKWTDDWDTTSKRIEFDFSETDIVAQVISQSTSSPTVTTDKLYNVAWDLYWNWLWIWWVALPWYTITNTTTDRTFDANSYTMDELADVLWTLVNDINDWLTWPQWLASDVLITENAQTGTTYTLVAGDLNKLVTFTNAEATTVTVPPNSSVAFAIGTQIDLSQNWVWAVTIAEWAWVTINSIDTYKTINWQWVWAALIKMATDTWTLYGNLKA